jgi:HlyD family secretion protein
MKLITSPFKKDLIPQPPQDRPRSRWRILVPLGVLIAGAGLTLPYLLSRPQAENLWFAPAETFPLTGQVKGDEIKVVAIVPGQVEWIAVREGDSVEQGQEVIQLHNQGLQAQLEEIQVQLTAAEQHEQQVEAEREVIRKKLWDAYLKLRPEERELDAWVRDADQDIIVAETQLAEARAELQRAKDDLGYAPENSVGSTQPQRQGTPRQQQQINQLEARVRGLEHELRLARGAWVRALSTGLSPYIHSPELDALRQQWVQVLDKLSEAKQAVFQITAKQQELEAKRSRLIIASPLDGIVTDRQVEPGDRAATGQTLLTIADSSRLYLEAYLPDAAQDIAQSSEQAKGHLEKLPYCKRTKAESAALP